MYNVKMWAHVINIDEAICVGFQMALQGLTCHQAVWTRAQLSFCQLVQARLQLQGDLEAMSRCECTVSRCDCRLPVMCEAAL